THLLRTCRLDGHQAPLTAIKARHGKAAEDAPAARAEEEQVMNETKRLWWTLAAILAVSFGVMLWLGGEIYRTMPPVPAAYVSADGEVIYSRADVETGRMVWQSTGGHQQGSIWGHGAYLAPDWTADWLHREAMALLDIWSRREFGKAYAQLEADHQAMLQSRLQREMRANTYAADVDRVEISADRAAAIREVAQHYAKLFSDDPELEALREDYAIRNNPIEDPARREALGAFIFWSAWAATTNRPGD